MRIIKFRGKRAKGECVGEWAYGELTQHDNLIWLEECEYFSGAYVQTDTIGQFTGLYDKNGKEIYEGDIVEVTVHGEGSFTSQVTFDDGAFVVCFYRGNYATLHDYNDSRYYRIRVIGNIYDNPELLKQ